MLGVPVGTKLMTPSRVRPPVPRGPHESTDPYIGADVANSELPLGIKILAGLNVVGALFALALVGRVFAFDHALAPVLGVALLGAIGAGLFFTYGLLTLKYWGWAGTVAFSGLGILVNLFAGNVVPVLVNGIVIAYLAKQRELYEPGS